MKDKTKKALAALCLGAVFMGLCACGSENEIQTADAEFRIGIAQAPDSMNPFVTEGGTSEEFFMLCYDSLWRQGETGEPVPDLVESWSLSSDSLTWTIRLRRDMTFSDGEPLTSEDVEFTYNLMCHCESMYAGYFNGISSVSCPDDYTVVITTEYVKGDMTENPAPILPEHIWADYEFSPEQFDNTELIGTGPFLYDTSVDTSEGWIFRARSLYCRDEESGQPVLGESGYAGDSPAAAVINFVSYGTETGVARALAAGEIDAAFGLTDVQLTTLEGVPGVTLTQDILPGARCEAMVFNIREGRLFEDETMRKIMEQCMDRQWFLSMSSGNLGQTGSVFASPGTDYFLTGVTVTGFDLEGAKSALQLAGYTDLDGDDILENNRTEEELSVTLYTSSDDVWAATAAAIFTADLESIGVKIKWKETPDGVENVCTAKADWDICMFSWLGNTDAVIAAGDFYEDVGTLSGWTSPNYESGLALLRTYMDMTDVHTQVKSLQQIAYDDRACLVLCYSADVQGIRSDQWTGYEEIIIAEGSMFRTGCRDIYMNVAPAAAE